MGDIDTVTSTTTRSDNACETITFPLDRSRGTQLLRMFQTLIGEQIEFTGDEHKQLALAFYRVADALPKKGGVSQPSRALDGLSMLRTHYAKKFVERASQRMFIQDVSLDLKESSFTLKFEDGRVFSVATSINHDGWLYVTPTSKREELALLGTAIALMVEHERIDAATFADEYLRSALELVHDTKYARIADDLGPERVDIELSYQSLGSVTANSFGYMANLLFPWKTSNEALFTSAKALLQSMSQIHSVRAATPIATALDDLLLATGNPGDCVKNVEMEMNRSDSHQRVSTVLKLQLVFDSALHIGTPSSLQARNRTYIRFVQIPRIKASGILGLAIAAVALDNRELSHAMPLIDRAVALLRREMSEASGE